MAAQQILNGMEFTIEWDNVKYFDPKFSDPEFADKLLDTLQDVNVEIGTTGYYEDSNNYFIEGEIIKDTKKEVNAEFTLFVEYMLRFFRQYFPKAKNINRSRIYFKIRP